MADFDGDMKLDVMYSDNSGRLMFAKGTGHAFDTGVDAVSKLFFRESITLL